MTRLLLGAVVAAAIAGYSPTFGQANPGANIPEQHGAADKVQNGANTTDGTTNGSSGPQDKGGGGANQPSADMCSDLKGDVQKACLSVVLGEDANGQPHSGGAQ